MSLYESNGRDRCWLVVNEGFISGPRRSQSFVGRGRRTPAAGFVRRETRAARRVFVPSARESTVTTREGAKEAPLLLLRAQARTLYVRSCARRRSRARAGEGALPLGPPSNFLLRKLLCRRYHTWISRTCLSLYESNGRDRCWLVVNEGFISGPRRSQSFVGRGRRTPAAGFVRRETRAARRVFVPSARESTVTTEKAPRRRHYWVGRCWTPFRREACSGSLLSFTVAAGGACASCCVGATTPGSHGPVCLSMRATVVTGVG